jgi:hypothetical protein
MGRLTDRPPRTQLRVMNHANRYLIQLDTRGAIAKPGAWHRYPIPSYARVDIIPLAMW